MLAIARTTTPKAAYSNFSVVRQGGTANLTWIRPECTSTPIVAEIDLPAWQGLPFQYVREQFADDYRTWKECPLDAPSPFYGEDS